MPLIDRLRLFCQQLFGLRPVQNQKDGSRTILRDLSSEPDVYFNSLSVMPKTPSNDSVGEKDFISVLYQGRPLWALFRCPCGCGNVISLSLQKIHDPNWTVSKSQAGRPTLYPSVWQNKGCCSHFWIEDGRVHWCGNTGVEPWVAEPKYYTKPGK